MTKQIKKRNGEVIYRQELNTKLRFPQHSKELDLFLTILSKVWELPANTSVFIPLKELKEILGYDRRTYGDMINICKAFFGKVQGQVLIKETNEALSYFSFFDTFKVPKKDYDTGQVEIRVHRDWKYALTWEQGKSYTIIDLQRVLKLNGKYTKLLYIFLNHWKNRNKIKIDEMEFRQWLEIPTSWRWGREIDIVIKKAIERLNEKGWFGKIAYSKGKTGKAISSITFYINGEIPEIKQLEKAKRKRRQSQKLIQQFENQPPIRATAVSAYGLNLEQLQQVKKRAFETGDTEKANRTDKVIYAVTVMQEEYNSKYERELREWENKNSEPEMSLFDSEVSL